MKVKLSEASNSSPPLYVSFRTRSPVRCGVCSCVLKSPPMGNRGTSEALNQVLNHQSHADMLLKPNTQS